MKVIIIGGVAAGTSAAAQMMRNDSDTEAVLYVADRDISYSSCGIPYYLGDKLELTDIVPRTPASFEEKYGVRVLTGHKVTGIDPKEKKITGEQTDGTAFEDSYDALVIATGARPVLPDVPGADRDNVRMLRTIEDTRRMMDDLNHSDTKHVVIVGTGFIGLEVLENLCARDDLKVTVLNRSDKITPHLDEDMAKHLEERLQSYDIDLRKNTSIQKITDAGADTGDEIIPADLILFATGTAPNVELAEAAGVEIGETGAIVVDAQMRTNVKDIYACGDCAQLWNVLDDHPMHVPLGTSANKTGKICGDVITGGNLKFHGILGTSIFRLFDLTIGATGYTEKQARELGYEVEVICQESLHRAGYFDGEKMLIKAVVDRKSARLLGAQLIGTHGIDKRLDVLITVITNQMDGESIYNLDLAYAPPYSTVNDAVHYIGLKLMSLEGSDA